MTKPLFYYMRVQSRFAHCTSRDVPDLNPRRMISLTEIRNGHQVIHLANPKAQTPNPYFTNPSFLAAHYHTEQQS